MNRTMRSIFPALMLGTLALGQPASADPARDAIINQFKAEAGVSSFSAERGKQFFHARHSSGKPETPSCSTCHTNDPRNQGRTRVGKVIEPMAVSRNPGRFTDPKKVAKWFRRNCRSVLGRECTALEKGDFLTYLSNL